MLTDDDFKKVNPEATQSVDILEFVELDKINPMYFDKPYYSKPTKQGRHAYALLREALAKSNRVALARVVIRTKEYIAAVKPIGDALVLELMHWASEIVNPETLELPGREKLPEQEMKMARMLIDTMSVDDFDAESFKNHYHDELLTMIEARAAGKELPKVKTCPRAGEGGQPDGRARAEPRREQEAPHRGERQGSGDEAPQEDRGLSRVIRRRYSRLRLRGRARAGRRRRG